MVGAAVEVYGLPQEHHTKQDLEVHEIGMYRIRHQIPTRHGRHHGTHDHGVHGRPRRYPRIVHMREVWGLGGDATKASGLAMQECRNLRWQARPPRYRLGAAPFTEGGQSQQHENDQQGRPRGCTAIPAEPVAWHLSKQSGPSGLPAGFLPFCLVPISILLG